MVIIACPFPLTAAYFTTHCLQYDLPILRFIACWDPAEMLASFLPQIVKVDATAAARKSGLDRYTAFQNQANVSGIRLQSVKNTFSSKRCCPALSLTAGRNTPWFFPESCATAQHLVICELSVKLTPVHEAQCVVYLNC